MAISVQEGYKEAQDKINAVKSYTNLKSDYDNIKRQAGDSFENAKENAAQSLKSIQDKTNKYQKQLKNQFDQLLDINKITGGKGSNSIKYIKKILIRTLRKIEPKIAEILMNECLSVVGCDQQQSYNAPNVPVPNGTVIYIKVKSIDLASLLKKDPNSDKGKPLYEKKPVVVQNYPFSMNKELYRLMQSDNSYYTDNGQIYLGRSGQPLFDIQYTETNDLGETGNFYKVTLPQRMTLGRLNNVSEFIVDYYKTIKVVDFNTTLAWVLEAMLGVISIKADVGINEVEEQSKVMAIIQRILGLCFDNRKVIDVSGISKLSESDDSDDSFFQLTDVDLRKIEERVNNIRNRVTKFETCGDVEVPVNADLAFQLLNDIMLVEGDNNEIDAADKITDNMVEDPNWNGLGLEGNIDLELNLDFVKNLVKGLAFSLFSPKILLPLAIMLKAIGKSVMETIESFFDFIKRFKSFFKNVISKIAGIFIKTLFDEIKRDIRNLIQNVIADLVKESVNKYVIMILKLIQLLVTIGQFISDWRECKSVVDEILWLLKIAATGWGSLPLPLLFGSQLLDGFSETRAFIGTITELQKIGIPTGPMPDGSPNLAVLSMFSSMKAQALEMAENGKVSIAIPPLTMTPAGVTIPAMGSGKSM